MRSHTQRQHAAVTRWHVLVVTVVAVVCSSLSHDAQRGLLMYARAQGVTPAPAAACANETNNPYCNLDYTNVALQRCVQARCAITEPVSSANVPLATYTSPWCNNSAPASEASASCATLMRAYNGYFACVVRAVADDTTGNVGGAAIRAAYDAYLRTPGFPYHHSPPAVAAHDFYQSEVVPRVLVAAQRTCPSDYVACCAQDPSVRPGDLPAKGYNHILCGVGCKTGLFLMAFTIISLCMMVACGCCWPTPSLRTTARAYKAAQAAAKAKRAALSDNDAPPLTVLRQPLQPVQHTAPPPPPPTTLPQTQVQVQKP